MSLKGLAPLRLRGVQTGLQRRWLRQQAAATGVTVPLLPPCPPEDIDIAYDADNWQTLSRY
jgi:hypothetical protein